MTGESIDPIFSLIERHRTAFNTFVNIIPIADEVAAEREGREVTEKIAVAFDAAGDAEIVACNALVGTPPTTLAGMRAAIQWFVEYDKGCVPEVSGRFVETLARSPVFDRV